MAKVTYVEPYETVRGKFSKSSNLVNKITPHKVQIAHRMGKRNLQERPYSTDEQAAQAKFTTRTKNVAARRKSSASTYPADMAAFLAQRDLPGGIKTFVKWLWADEKKKGNA